MLTRFSLFVITTAAAAALLGGGLALVAGGGAPVQAQESIVEQTMPSLSPESGAEEERRNLRALLQRLRERDAELDAREREVIERERQAERVQDELEREMTRLEELRGQVRDERRALETRTRPAFERLVRAYRSMEPENAARALTRLGRDERETAIELFMALDSRSAGQLLDAMAERDPELAAFYTRTIWERDPDTLRRQLAPAGLFGRKPAAGTSAP